MGAVSEVVSEAEAAVSAVLAEDFPAVAGFPEDFKYFYYQHSVVIFLTSS